MPLPHGWSFRAVGESHFIKMYTSKPELISTDSLLVTKTQPVQPAEFRAQVRSPQIMYLKASDELCLISLYFLSGRREGGSKGKEERDPREAHSMKKFSPNSKSVPKLHSVD